MQFLPTNTTDTSQADFFTSAAAQGNSAFDLSQQTHNGLSFDKVYSSFIEEGREKYCGLPQGFSAFVTEGGTVSRQNSDFFKDELKKRNVHDMSMQTLKQLIGSGEAVTIGKIFGTLSGKSRVLEPLKESEKNDFLQIMQKIGLTQDQAKELVYMTDAGKTSQAWQKISKQMEMLSAEKVELHSDELSAVLNALDISSSGQKLTNQMFKQFPEGALQKEQLSALFAEVNKEIAAKDKASLAVSSVMREAMAAALSTAKAEKNAQPVASTRGSKHSQSMEQKMRHTLSKAALHLGGDESTQTDLANESLSKAKNNDSAAQTSAEHSKAAKTAQNEALARGEFSTLAGKTAGVNTGAGANTGVNQTVPSALHNGSPNAAMQHNFAGNSSQQDFEQAPRDSKGSSGKEQSRAELILGKAPSNKQEQVTDKAMVKDAMESLVSKVNLAGAGAGATSTDALSGNMSKTENFQQAIFSQVEQGVLQTAQNGAKHLTLQINQGEAGQVTLLLTVKNGEVRATMRTDDPDNAALLSERLGELKASLEESGLKVAKLEVETRLGEDSSFKQWEGSKEHNAMQDAEERARMARLSILRRGEALASPVQMQAGVNVNQTSGLNIVA